MTAALLRALHVPGRPLVLPNAWDVGTARLVAEAGFPAVATSSAAVAESLGYADHQGAPADEMLAVAARIARAVDVPVTVDAEAGYGLPPAELAARLVDAGVAGCNLEDTAHPGGRIPPSAQADYLAAVRASGLVVNARVDSFVGVEDQAAVLPEAVERARTYLAAGADCVYPILLRPVSLVREFVEAVDGPVNAVLLPDMTVGSLASAGVARVSLGPGLWRLTQSVLRERLAGLA